MNKNRLEAFSDGVLAIIITIMVLEIKVPHGAQWSDIAPLLPVLSSYAISFLFIGIYWGNHHHLLHTVRKVNSGIIWSNLVLLFWLSLIPFATGWMGENHFATNTVVLYGILLMLCGISYTVLERIIALTNPITEQVADAFKKQGYKSMVSTIANVAAIPIAYYNTAISVVLFLISSLIWLVPDKNIEKALS
jgi:uncharacterized membrane protein